MTKRAAALLLVLVAVAVGCSGSASAEKLDVRRLYEETLVQNALRDTGLVVDAAPEGKMIEHVVIVANDVIQPGDYGIPYRVPVVYPLLSRVSWLNHLHVRSRDYIIRQELLFGPGETYHADVVAETGRNLRNLFILAVARIVVARGSTPERVVVLVVTKDNWTLRLNTDFVIDQSRLDSLAMSISESNVAGRNKTVSVQYALDPGRHTVGLGWIDPRIESSRHQLQLLGDVFLSRSRSAAEGGFAQLVTGRPLYSLRTQWGWQLDGSFLQDIARTFQGGGLRQLKYNDELIPDAYARRQVIANLAGTRSFGVLDKLNLTLGFRVTSTRYRLPDDFPTTLSTGARAAYTAYLPRSESASGPYLAAVAYRAAFVRLQNIDTFALSEDFRLGPKASFEIRFADPVFGFSSRFWAFSASYAATYWRRDNLFTFSMSAGARLEGGILANQSWVNQVYDASFHETTPRFGPFRLHVAGALELRRNDLAHTRVSLGLDSGLRGFDTRYFIGNNFYRANVELRSIALNLWTLHVGGVIFYDGGDAPASLLSAGYHQDAGVGLRILFPQFDREVLRFDLAFPFERGAGGVYGPRFSVGFGQAF